MMSANPAPSAIPLPTSTPILTPTPTLTPTPPAPFLGYIQIDILARADSDLAGTVTGTLWAPADYLSNTTAAFSNLTFAASTLSDSAVFHSAPATDEAGTGTSSSRDTPSGPIDTSHAGYATTYVTPLYLAAAGTVASSVSDAPSGPTPRQCDTQQ